MAINSNFVIVDRSFCRGGGLFSVLAIVCCVFASETSETSEIDFYAQETYKLNISFRLSIW